MICRLPLNIITSTAHSRLIIRVLRKSVFLDKRYFIFLRKIFDSTIHLYILASNSLIHYMLDNV